MWSAFESGAAKAAHMKAYDQIGAEAAEEIRNRFYQKEFKAVNNLKLAPLIQEAQEARAEYEAETALAIRPVQRAIGVEEGQAISDALAEPGEPQIVKTPGDGPDKTMPGAPIKPPNMAINPGSAGAVEVIDSMSILDLEGNPVAIDTPQGKALLDQAADKFWGRYGDINTRIMDVLGEFQGNPFVDHAASTMIENTMRQAGQGVSGKSTPEEQQAWWEDRQKFDAEQEAAGAKASMAQENLMKAQADRAAQAQSAAAYAGDPTWAGQFDPKLRDKLLSGKELTDTQSAKAAATLRRIEQLIKLDQVRAADQGILKMPSSVRSQEPVGWQAFIRSKNDRNYNDYLDESLNEGIVNLTQEALANPDEFVGQYNAPGYVKVALDSGVLDDRSKGWFEAEAQKGGGLADAHATAFARRLSELNGGDPQMQRRSISYLDNIIAEAERTGRTLDPHLRELMATYPEGAISYLTTGGDPLQQPPVNYNTRVRRYRANLAAQEERASGTPLSTAPAVAPVEGVSSGETTAVIPDALLKPVLGRRKLNIRELSNLVEMKPEAIEDIPVERLNDLIYRINDLLATNLDPTERERLVDLQRRLGERHSQLGTDPLKRLGKTIGEGVKGLFVTTEEEKQQAAQARLRRYVVE
jgi:hypothetical protein